MKTVKSEREKEDELKVRRFENMQQKANLKAYGMLFTAMLLLLVASYFLVQIIF